MKAYCEPKNVNQGIFRPLLVYNKEMKQIFWENFLWAPADYHLSLGNGMIHNRTVRIHVSEFRPENEILGRIKS